MQPVETGSMLCDIKQRTSDNITVKVNDGRTKRPVDSAEVMFTCGAESCPIGTLANGTLTAQFPRCLGGMLGIQKNVSPRLYHLIDSGPLFQ